MMLKKCKNVARIVVMLSIAALTAFASISQADAGGCDGDNHRQHSFKRFEKKLGLSDAQKAQAKAIFQGNKDVVKPIITSLRAERKNLWDLIHADAIDEAAIRAETAKIAGIQADLNVNRAKAGAQFRAILTPAQQAILKTLHEKRCNKKTNRISEAAE